MEHMGKDIEKILPITIIKGGIAVLCFIVLSVLIAIETEGISIIFIFFILGCFYGVGSIGLYSAILTRLNRHINRSYVVDAVSAGFLSFMPFAILALIADLVFDWSSVQVFISAGFMATGVAISMEMAKKGQIGKGTVFLSSGLGFLLSFLWTLGCHLLFSLFQAIN